MVLWTLGAFQVSKAGGLEPLFTKDLNGTVNENDTRDFVGASGRMYFSFYDYAYGYELWTSDGTYNGTKMLKDFLPGIDSGGPLFFKVYDQWVYFNIFNNTHNVILGKSQGTPETTQYLPAQDVSSSSSDVGVRRRMIGDYFVSLVDSQHGTELWVISYPGGEPVFLKDIYPGSASSGISGLTRAGYWVVFTAQNTTQGYELWRSGGSRDTTTVLKDIQPGAPGSVPGGFVEFGTKALFHADDAIHGRELWITDATPDGTFMVKDIDPAAGASGFDTLGVIWPTESIAYFVAVKSGQRGLWKTDGTEAGTSLVRLLPADSSVHYVGFLGNQLFFQYLDPVAGYELWSSDGTEGGTRLLYDLNPGSESTLILDAESWDGYLVFHARDWMGGPQTLWATAGTPGSTIPLVEFGPATLPDVNAMTRADNKLFCLGMYMSGGAKKSKFWVYDLNQLHSLVPSGNQWVFH